MWALFPYSTRRDGEREFFGERYHLISSQPLWTVADTREKPHTDSGDHPDHLQER